MKIKTFANILQNKKQNTLNDYFCPMKAFRSFVLAVCVSAIISCNDSDANGNIDAPASSAPLLSYTVAGTYPHDTSAFTQGFAFYEGKLYEGTGMTGESRLMELDLNSGKISRQVELDSTFFGEGVTILNDTLYQLTWQNKVVLVYSVSDLKKIKEFPINTEGWGITNDSTHLIVSDGTSNLYFYDPSTFRLMRTQGVTEAGTPSYNINELEYINGYIYANQWQSNYILKIDPNSGQVVGKFDLSQVVDRLKAKYPGMDTEQSATLNGIAYNPQTNKIYVTGKYWPETYEIQFEH